MPLQVGETGCVPFKMVQIHLAALFIVDWVKIMKVFVNDLPKEPKECLFSVSQIRIDHTQKNGCSWSWYCGMDHTPCDLVYEKKCDKLSVNEKTEIT